MTFILDPETMPTTAELARDTPRHQTRPPARPTPPPVDRLDFIPNDAAACVGCGADPADPCHPACDVTYPF